MKLVNIGFGSVVSAGRIVAMVSPESAPIKRLTQEARERGSLVDASFGRKTQCVLIMDSGHGDLVLPGLQKRSPPASRSSRDSPRPREMEDEEHE